MASEPETIEKILRNTKVIALVGASNKPERDSNEVMRFLQARGYRVIPVNPGLAGKEINGEKVYGTLADIGEPVERRRPDTKIAVRAHAHVRLTPRSRRYPARSR